MHGGTHDAALVAMVASRPFRNEEDGRMLHPGDPFETNAARAAELAALGLAERRAGTAPADPPDPAWGERPDDAHPGEQIPGGALAGEEQPAPIAAGVLSPEPLLEAPAAGPAARARKR